MPSAPIGRPTPTERDDRRRTVGIAWAALTALTAALLLTGCNTGDVREVRGAQQRDARQTPQMPRQQATLIAEKYFPATPDPTRSPPIYPFVGELAVTLAANGDGSPQGAFASVPVDAGTLYAAARLHGASSGQIITAIWTDAWGNTVGQVDQPVALTADSQWIDLPLPLSSGLTPGDYAVWLYAGEQRIGSLAFGLTAPGNAPQMYPERPANPQAPVAQPTRPPEQPRETQSGQSDGQQNEQDQQASGDWQQNQQEGGDWQQSQQGGGDWQPGQQNQQGSGGDWQQNPQGGQGDWQQNPQSQASGGDWQQSQQGDGSQWQQDPANQPGG